MAHFSVFFYLHFACRHFFSWLVCDAYKKWLSRWKIKSVYIKRFYLLIHEYLLWMESRRSAGEWMVNEKLRSKLGQYDVKCEDRIWNSQSVYRIYTICIFWDGISKSIGKLSAYQNWNWLCNRITILWQLWAMHCM